MKNEIIVGVDPTPSGVAALEWALTEAVSTGAPVLALRAWSPTAMAVEAYTYAPADVDPMESATAQLVADEQLKLAIERVPGAEALATTASAVLGSAAQVLVEHSTPHSTVVVGCCSHRALSRAVLGSVSSSVLHHAAGPVTIVPAPRTTDQSAPRVIVGMDHSRDARRALTAAVEQAGRRGATLVPVYVREPLVLPRGGPHAPDIALLEDSERHLLDAEARAAGGTDVRSQILTGNPVARLLELARPQDLLVLGSRGRGGFAALLLGSTSTQVAQHAPCPVLVIRP